MGETCYRFIDQNISPTTQKKIEAYLDDPKLIIEDDDVIDVNAVVSDDEDTWLYTSKFCNTKSKTNQNNISNIQKIHSGTYNRPKKVSYNSDNLDFILNEEECPASPKESLNLSDSSLLSVSSLVNLNNTSISNAFLDNDLSVDSVKKFLERTPKPCSEAAANLLGRSNCDSNAKLKSVAPVGEMLITEDTLKHHQLIIEEQDQVRDLLAEKYEQSDKSVNSLKDHNVYDNSNLLYEKSDNNNNNNNNNNDIKKCLFEITPNRKGSFHDTIVALENKIGLVYDNNEILSASSNTTKFDRIINQKSFLQESIERIPVHKTDNYYNDRFDDCAKDTGKSGEFLKSPYRYNSNNSNNNNGNNLQYTKNRWSNHSSSAAKKSPDDQLDIAKHKIIQVVPSYTSTPAQLHLMRNTPQKTLNFEDCSSSEDESTTTTDDNIMNHGTGRNSCSYQNEMNVSYIKISPENHISKLPKYSGPADSKRSPRSQLIGNFNSTFLRRKSDDSILKDNLQQHIEDDRTSSSSDCSLSSTSYTCTGPPSIADVQILAHMQEISLKEQVNEINRSARKQATTSNETIDSSSSSDSGKKNLDRANTIKKLTTGFSNSMGRIHSSTVKSGLMPPQITKASSSETVMRNSRFSTSSAGNSARPPPRAQSTSRTMGITKPNLQLVPPRPLPVVLPTSSSPKETPSVFKIPPQPPSTQQRSSVQLVSSHIPRLSSTKIPVRNSTRQSGIPTTTMQRK